MPSSHLFASGIEVINAPVSYNPESAAGTKMPPLPDCECPIFMMNRRPIDGEQLVISPCLPGCVVSQADLVSSIKGMGFLAAGQLHAEALLETGVPEEWKMFTLFFAGTLWTPRDQMFETIFIPIITHHGGRAEIGFHRSSCPVGPESRIVLTSNKIM